jgi:hypothetical protein
LITNDLGEQTEASETFSQSIGSGLNPWPEHESLRKATTHFSDSNATGPRNIADMIFALVRFRCRGVNVVMRIYSQVAA